MIELLIGGGVLVLLLIAGFMYYVMSIRFAKPNEAMLITGKSDPNPTEDMSEDQSRVVINNRAFVNPITERVSHISLSSRQVEVTIEAISNNGIQLRLAGVAQVKVGGDKASVRKAAQRFLDQQDAIDHYTQETLSGSLRSIVGTLSVDAIIKDRAQFAASVKEEAEHSMTNQGLVIDTFQIKSVEDSSGYLKNLGRPEAALVARNASIAEANSQREAAEAKALADQKTAEAEQKLALRRAELKQETDARQAEADAAGPLAQAEQQQAIILKNQQVVARQAELREKELDIEVRKPADAAKYKVETEAAADLARRTRISEATKVEAAAELETRKLKATGNEVEARALAAANTAKGNAETEINKIRGLAEAEVIKSKGVAEADVIGLRGKAEAGAIEAQAKAYSEFNEAAILNKVLEVLPGIAREIASPMGAISNMTVISNDGASQLSKNVSSGVQETAQMLKDTTGFDVIEMLSGFGKSRPAGEAKSTNDGAVEEPARTAVVIDTAKDK
ncbi:SPFH domain-containing protein [Arthrobacter sp.]|uniref:flotillin family protein n=1 Tax=Arthrobacter sp. TaxID=1667 RepID=UPI002811F2B6|nr:SPFH domain-containing protein [Arthrobacter sp.]